MVSHVVGYLRVGMQSLADVVCNMKKLDVCIRVVTWRSGK